jgi:hypothetical protein
MEKNGGLLEFSGVSSDCQKVMGVARMSQHYPTKEKHLTWNVPNSWNLKQAATVPLAYSTVSRQATLQFLFSACIFKCNKVSDCNDLFTSGDKTLKFIFFGYVYSNSSEKSLLHSW